MIDALGAFIAWVPGGVWIVIGTIVSGFLLKAGEKWLNREGGERANRQEHRTELKELNDRIDKLEDEIGTWRRRYYAEQEEAANLRMFIIQNGQAPPERKAPVV